MKFSIMNKIMKFPFATFSRYTAGTGAHSYTTTAGVLALSVYVHAAHHLFLAPLPPSTLHSSLVTPSACTHTWRIGSTSKECLDMFFRY